MGTSVGCLAVIPARGGSKAIPRKNSQLFLGKPLLVWTVECAKRSQVCDRIILSTDDDEMASLGQEAGAEVLFRRPVDLATDQAPTAPVVRHALQWLKDREGWTPSRVVVLEPTAPARQPWQIDESMTLLEQRGADSVASISAVPHHYVPQKLLRLQPDHTIVGISGTAIRDMIHRRQDLEPCYAFNGLIFGCTSELIWHDPPTLWGQHVTAYVTDSKYQIDLDQPEDWAAAESRCRQLLNEATYLAALQKAYGTTQVGLTQQYKTGWRCRCEEDHTLSCGPQLEDCLRRHGRILQGCDQGESEMKQQVPGHKDTGGGA